MVVVEESEEGRERWVKRKEGIEKQRRKKLENAGRGACAQVDEAEMD